MPQWASEMCKEKSLYAMVIVMVMVVHVLHRDPAPHADYKCLDFTLVVSTSDTEVAVLTPILSPGVGSNPIFLRCTVKMPFLSPPKDPD